MNIEAMESQIDEAEGLLVEEVRAENSRIAYRLARMGIDVLDLISSTEDQEALQEELKEMLKKGPRRSDAASNEGDELDSFFMSEHEEREQL